MAHATFRRIWLASLLSNLGLLIQAVGAAWAMTQMTSSADKVALVQTALMLPVMLISMPAGAIADMKAGTIKDRMLSNTPSDSTSGIQVRPAFCAGERDRIR